MACSAYCRPAARIGDSASTSNDSTATAAAPSRQSFAALTAPVNQTARGRAIGPSSKLMPRVSYVLPIPVHAPLGFHVLGFSGEGEDRVIHQPWDALQAPRFTGPRTYARLPHVT